MRLPWQKKPTSEAEMAAAAFDLATGWHAAQAHGDKVRITVYPAECAALTKAYTDHTTVT